MTFKLAGHVVLMCAYMPLKLYGISRLITRDTVTQKCISRNVLQPALTTLRTVEVNRVVVSSRMNSRNDYTVGYKGSSGSTQHALGHELISLSQHSEEGQLHLALVKHVATASSTCDVLQQVRFPIALKQQAQRVKSDFIST